MKKETNRNLYFEALYGAFGVMAVALVLAEIAVFLIYSWLEPEALATRMTISGFITIIVSFPIGYYIHRQNAKLQQLSKELAMAASLDQMSGLLNRTSFLTAVKAKLHTPLAGPTAGSFLFIDVDHFKKLNDQFGHSVGDDAIKMVADTIKETTSEKCLVGRIGGEEFGVFLSGANQKQAISIAENVRRRIRKIVFDNGNARQQLSVSIGGAMHHAGQTIGDFMQMADERMYIAKSQGRNRVVFVHEPATQVPQIKQSA